MDGEGFLVIPAVDIRGGRCVRLRRGLPEEETVFGEDPVEAALLWESQGAELIHVVDLDGAFAGEPVNRAVIEKLARRVGVPVEVGGGIRDSGVARGYIEAGVARVVVGTRAFTDPSWLARLAGELGDRLVVGVDAKEGLVAVSGWTGDAGLSPLEAVAGLEEAGVKRIIYTNVGRDGTLEGPDFEGTEAVARAASMPVIASGGVGGMADIERVRRMRSLGVEGVIVGMALYRGDVTMDEVVSAFGGGGAA